MAITARARRLQDWIDSLDVDALVDEVVRAADAADRAAARARIETYLNEAAVGLATLESALDADPRRLLEIGSGIGVLLRFLGGEGFEIVGIEPSSGGGFDFMETLGAAIETQRPLPPNARLLRLRVEELDPAEHGRFDLVYSINVIEHLSDLDTAFARMVGVLTDDGHMVHDCPNYVVPYEPHLAIPLVPGRPRWTRFVFPRRIAAHEDVWSSLNFVTAGTIVALARRHGLKARLRSGRMGSTFARLRDDAVFRRRQAWFLAALASNPVTATTVHAFLRAVPPRWATPMVVEVAVEPDQPTR